MADGRAKTKGQLEQELSQRRRQADLNEAILHTAGALVVVLDRDGRIVLFNRACEQATGYSAEEVLGQAVWDRFLTAEDQAPVRQMFANVSSGCFPKRHENAWLTKTGQRRLIDWSNGTLLDEKGEVTLVIGTGIDVTERRRAEDALRESEERFSKAFRSSPALMAISNLETGLIYEVNDAFLRALGYDRGEVIGNSTVDLGMFVDPVQRETILKDLRQTGHVDAAEVDVRTRDGSVRRGVFSADVIQLGDKPYLLTAMQDITERAENERAQRRLEARLQQAQKLESLTKLAGGIAHDFNNLLVGILGNASVALMDLPSESELRPCVQDIEDAARMAADLVRQLVACSGRAQLATGPVQVGEMVWEMRKLLEASVSGRATLRLELEDAPMIHADLDQLRQALLNVVTNSAEASEDRSAVITVRVRRQVCDREFLSSTCVDDRLPTGAYTCLEIVDTGHGMDPATQTKVFDPFYSTKFPGRGLGLAAALGIVRGHGGAIRLRSEPGQGTHVQLVFPALDEARTVQPPPQTQADDFHGQGTVLLVDDEPTVRNAGRRMLARLGFDVVTAEDGVAAIERFEREPERFTLILLDLTMPRMGGEEAFRRLHAIRPNVPILLASGYDQQQLSTRLSGLGLAGFVPKPYELRGLREKLRDALR